MSKTIKVTTDNKLFVIDIDFGDYKSLQKAVGGFFETVRTRRMLDYFKNGTLFLCDEEGLLKGLPLNHLGSWLYSSDQHGNLIVGDIVFARVDGEDIVAPEDVPILITKLITDFPFLEVENE